MNIFCIAARFVYPSIKRRLVEILYTQQKMTQKEIASRLYISQSTVSKYLQMERASYLDIATCRDIDRIIWRLAKIILLRNLPKKELEIILARIALKALATQCICRFHKQIDPSIDPNKCDMCVRLFSAYRDWDLEEEIEKIGKGAQ